MAAFFREAVTHMQETETTKSPRAPPAASTPTRWLTAHLRLPRALRPRPRRCLLTRVPPGAGANSYERGPALGTGARGTS